MNMNVRLRIRWALSDGPKTLGLIQEKTDLPWHAVEPTLAEMIGDGSVEPIEPATSVERDMGMGWTYALAEKQQAARREQYAEAG